MRIRPPLADALVAAAIAGLALMLAQEAPAQGWPALDGAGYALVAALHLPLVRRTRHPVAVCLFVDAVWTAYVTAGYWPVVSSFGPMLALYTVASTRGTRTTGGCAALMAAVWLYAGLLHADANMVSVAGQALVFPAVLWRFGWLSRRSAELARRLRAEQEERARREVAAERGRIARELHDVVAHHMAVISVQSSLAWYVLDSDTETARTALGTINGTSGEAMEELRRILALLRADDADAAPSAPMPGLDRLDDMVNRVRAGGAEVDLRITGMPRPLAPGVGLCLYRVTQEALTNVLKHAPGARTTVEVTFGSGEVRVEITDDGGGTIPANLPAGSGHGLIGMRERAKLYGGTIRIGPRREGGFAVSLTLPTAARATGQGDDTAR
ncbi:sensor histidine kinase [Streptomyces bambusae]|uniref:sensor histidine kinase n=1 Tax=Streptomyces bambusae TaxID=1550616 RepID=UPI001CFECFC2|nr:sensor histidine kinase [Streptomyces bambusae]MCB5164468.1 sensor histidine kinase [Streptomyces bambusae]